MSEIKGIPPQPIQRPEPAKGQTPIQKPKGTDATAKITQTEGTPETSPPLSPELPNVPKPEPKKLSPEEIQEIAETLGECAAMFNQSLIIPGQNARALSKLAEGTKFPDDLMEQAEQAWENKPTEEFVNSLSYSLGDYIDRNGNFTPEAQEFFRNPSSAKSKDEAFSLFALMILLNQLSSSQRTEAFKAMQAEQNYMMVLFNKKKEIIENKAWSQIWLTLSSVVTSAATSGFGGAAGLYGSFSGVALSENALSNFFTSVGRFAGEAVSGFGNPIIAQKHDVAEAERGAKEQKTQYNKSLQEDAMRQLRDLANTLTKAGEDIISRMTSAKSTIGKNIV